MYDKPIKTIPENKLEEDKMAKKQKSPEAEAAAEPKQDSAAARLVKTLTVKVSMLYSVYRFKINGNSSAAYLDITKARMLWSVLFQHALN